MAVYRARRPAYGAKIFLTLLLAVLAGFVWATIETGQSPPDLLNVFSPVDEPKEEPDNSHTVAPPPKPDPPPNPELKRNPDPPPDVKPSLYTSAKLEPLFRELEGHIRHGRFEKAESRISSLKRERVPPESLSLFDEYDRRIRSCLGLIQETQWGTTIPVPEMWRLFVKDASRLVVKFLRPRGDYFSFELMKGGRSRIPKRRIDRMEALNKDQARAEVLMELKSRCRAAGIETREQPDSLGTRYHYTETRPVPAWKYFELADFCARNGINDRLAELFAEALRRDPDLVRSAHEIKARRLADTLLYFISIRAEHNAKQTHDILQHRYADTEAYRNKIDGDTRKALGSATIPELPTPGPAPEPDPEPEPTPPPTVSSGKHTLRLPQGASGTVRILCAGGDANFSEAKRHILNSDPKRNPDGWADEVRHALELLEKARDDYHAAQDAYANSADIPNSLLDRIRETMRLAFWCRKRSL